MLKLCCGHEQFFYLNEVFFTANFLQFSEKELVLDMIRAISTSDYEFREGYENAVSSPLYEDQLLQHESSLDVDAINSYNESQRRKNKKEDNEEQPQEEIQKPKYGNI